VVLLLLLCNVVVVFSKSKRKEVSTVKWSSQHKVLGPREERGEDYSQKYEAYLSWKVT